MTRISQATGTLTFLGIGAQKAGTTWLAKMLAMHPDIEIPIKELHFWDHPPFTPALIEKYQARFRDCTKRACGEITPRYSILPQDTLRLIRAHFPGLRIIYILRNPIERAWSHVRMEYAREVFKKGRAPNKLNFEWFAGHFRSEESVSRGDYAACLENWLACFPADRIKLFIYETDLKDPREMLASCCRHLGVDDSWYASIADGQLNLRVYPEIVQEGIKRADLPSIPPPEYARVLVEIYADRIAKAEEIVGEDLEKLWLAPYL